MLADEPCSTEGGIVLSGSVDGTSVSDADACATELAALSRRSSGGWLPPASTIGANPVGGALVPSEGLLVLESRSCCSRLGTAQPVNHTCKMTSQLRRGCDDCIRPDPQSLPALG